METKKKQKLKKIKKEKALVTTPLIPIEDVLKDSYQFSRWIALYEAVNIIFEHSQERNKNFADVELKPLAIQKFVDIKADEVLQQIYANQKQ